MPEDSPRSRCRFPALWCLMSMAATAVMVAAEPIDKPAKKPDLPRVLVVQPPGLEVGTLNKLRVRGLFLTNATAVQLHSGSTNQAFEIKGRGNAVKLDGFEPARVGDQRLEVELTLPAGTIAGTNSTLVVIGPDGQSEPFALLVLPGGSVVGEKEPNNGFREAPGTRPPINIRGALDSTGDVDVFRVGLEAGQTLHAEIFASRFGSTLDALLTLHTAGGAVLATNDDSVGRDPVLEYKVASSGDYFVAVSYVNEKAAATHEYVLQLRVP